MTIRRNDPAPRRRRALLALTTGFTTLAVLATGESTLRVFGVGPWRPSPRSGEPVVYEPDETLGWRNRRGHYQLAPYPPSGREVELTFLAGGRRRTAETAHEGPVLALVGGSFTQGWAVSDPETFAWKLQTAVPGVQIENYGTGGYGTLQSLLVVERALLDPTPPLLVLYGFMGHHEYRNVANAYWLDLLARNASRGHVAVPYATLAADGSLRRHAPTHYPSWPLREHSALVSFTGRLWMKARTLPRRRQARAVTEALLLEMAAAVASRGSRFAVVLLAADDPVRSHYTAFLAERGVRSIDCVEALTPELQVPGEGHPNEVLHSRWADCIAAAVRPVIDSGLGQIASSNLEEPTDR